jgi:hypothetical protein
VKEFDLPGGCQVSRGVSSLFCLGGVLEALIVKEGQVVLSSADLQPRHATEPLATTMASLVRHALKSIANALGGCHGDLQSRKLLR